MRILVTGAKGFVGKNLCAQLNNIKNRTDRRFKNLSISEVYEYDLDSSDEELDAYCKKCCFVFNLAGVNRPEKKEDYISGNCDFLSKLLSILKKNKNFCPIMLSSSIQAILKGRYENSLYGQSKRIAEDLLFSYAQKFGSDVFVYRFPNIFGKWSKPNYNSAVATFCYNIANDLPIFVNDKNMELELLYIDDLVDEMIKLLFGLVCRCEYNGMDIVPSVDGRYCFCPQTYRRKLGDVVDLINLFATQSKSICLPEMPSQSLEKKLYSTYLSYLPKEKVVFPLKTKRDDRGSFTELIRTCNSGQISVNISKPGITKGQHWHNTKWEYFVVVFGNALIQQRCLYSNEVLNFEVSGANLEVVQMLPGYTHNIINLSDTEDLITIMYSNENFDIDSPDTYYERV